MAGHDIMALERFAPGTQHMVILDVLSHESPVGDKGEKMRLFLTEQGYKKALKIRIRDLSKLRTTQKSWQETSAMTVRGMACKNASIEF